MPISSRSDFVFDAMKHDPFSQPFDGVRKDIDAAEAVFDGRDDEVLNIFAFDASSRGDMGNCLAITAIERKGNADLFFVIAADFQNRPSTNAMSNFRYGLYGVRAHEPGGIHRLASRR